MRGDHAEYYLRRASMGCSNCMSFDRIDAVSRLCPSCKKHLIIHGSPRISKPTLKTELHLAYQRIADHCDISQASEVFNRFMLSYASPSKDDKLKRLCWLHFIKLKASDGEPLMRFVDTLTQVLAVIIYEQDGGRLDNKKKQYQYLLGRASVSPWHRRRTCKQGLVYAKEERRGILRKPLLFHRAFDEIFIRGGISRFLVQLNNKIYNNYDGTKVPSNANG
jgi:hypothetical protein